MKNYEIVRIIYKAILEDELLTPESFIKKNISSYLNKENKKYEKIINKIIFHYPINIYSN